MKLALDVARPRVWLALDVAPPWVWLALDLVPPPGVAFP